METVKIPLLVVEVRHLEVGRGAQLQQALPKRTTPHKGGHFSEQSARLLNKLQQVLVVFVEGHS